MLKYLGVIARRGVVTRPLPDLLRALAPGEEPYLSAVAADPRAAGEALRRRIRRVLGRSLAIRHLDAGSCNGCDWELVALLNPVYDVQRLGLDFVASPRHADCLVVTGVVTRHLAEAARLTHDATPDPRVVVAVGACALGQAPFGPTYAQEGAAGAVLPVDVCVPGCPPRPEAIIAGLLLAVDRLDEAKRRASGVQGPREQAGRDPEGSAQQRQQQ